MKINIFRFLIILVSVQTSILIADETEVKDSVNYELKPKYGLVGAYNFNLHSSSITNIKGFNSCCPEFTGGYGNGFYVGGLFEYPLNEEMELMLRISYNSYNGLLSESVNLPVYDAVTGGSITATIENRFDVQYGTIGIEPMFSHKIKDNLFAHAGFRAGLLVDHNYSHIEEITNPKNRGTFSNGLQTWNVSSGEVPESNILLLGLQLGLSYNLPLNKNKSLFLAPEIFYHLQFTPLIKEQSWNVHQFRLGASIKYRQPPPPPPPPPPPLDPPYPGLPLPQEPPILAASVSVVEVDSLGNENKNFSLKIEDFVSYNMRPLLTYVFFDSLSSEIPDKYIKYKKSEVNDFTESSLHNLGPIETYYQILNIIGMRMQQHPETTIKITGTNSNSGDEKGNTSLSRDRAVNVRDYLRDVWGIDGTRMPIVARNLPEKFTRQDDPGSDSENRRVEIIASAPIITEPVFTIDTMRILSKYDLRFKPLCDSDVGIKNWELKVMFENKELANYDGKGNVPKNLNWKLENNTNGSPKTAGNIFYYLMVTDSLGQTATSSKNRIPVEQLTIDRKRLERIKDKEFEYYSLILFDFGKSDLRSEHNKVVDFIKDRITDNAKVYVRGYTDLIGEEEINKRISEKRANAVAKRLKIPRAIVEGIGEEVVLYNNDTPEGRYYCRTVQIIIETPVHD
ncbi:MAG: OmpA family protein [Candidatus Kapabacteria bacterium]|jgi:outer membrane protein OmpA-like peptidoglycan-associated protein|nr:OmpA family protein [Candidatus Kapabacteria bacterium]